MTTFLAGQHAKTLAKVLLATTLGLGLGCNKSSSGPSPAGSASPEAQAPAFGLDAASNDAAVVALAKKALGCKWGTFGFDSACPEMKAFTESTEIREGKADATLVSFLEDANERVRWIGSRALSQRGRVFRTDKALAERIVKVAEGEKSKVVAQELGGVVGGIKHTDTGLGDKIKQMAKSHDLLQMRTSLLARMLFANGDTLYDFVKDIAANDKDIIVRKAAMSAFWTGTTPNKIADSCAMWLGFVDDPIEDVAGEAAYLCSFYPQGGGCKAEWDPLLDKIEKRAKSGELKSTQLAAALAYLQKQPGASEAQRKRALAVARQIAENPSNGGMARGRALELVAEKDPEAKKLLEKLKDDNDVFVKSRAKDLAERAAKNEGAPRPFTPARGSAP